MFFAWAPRALIFSPKNLLSLFPSTQEESLLKNCIAAFPLLILSRLLCSNLLSPSTCGLWLFGLYYFRCWPVYSSLGCRLLETAVTYIVISQTHFQNYYSLVSVRVHACVYVCMMSMPGCGGKKVALDPLELELKMDYARVEKWTWVF